MGVASATTVTAHPRTPAQWPTHTQIRKSRLARPTMWELCWYKSTTEIRPKPFPTAYLDHEPNHTAPVRSPITGMRLLIPCASIEAPTRPVLARKNDSTKPMVKSKGKRIGSR